MGVEVFTIIGIMVVCGGLGGFGAWLLSPGVESDGTDIRYKGVGYVGIGIIASIAVPLFLSMAQSDLIEVADSGAVALKNGFVFAGFCIVAGFSSRAFLSSISDKIIKDLQQKTEEAEQVAEESSEEVEALRRLIAQEVEPVEPDENVRGEVLDNLVSGLDHTQKKVLKATGSLTMRTASGIAKSAEIPRNEVSKVIDDLVTSGLAERTLSPRTNNLRFKVTPKGVSVLNRLGK